MAKKQSKEPKAKTDPKAKTGKADVEKAGIKPLDPPPPGGYLGMATPKKPKDK
jgi:hypothetical protein